MIIITFDNLVLKPSRLRSQLLIVYNAFSVNIMNNYEIFENTENALFRMVQWF